MMSNAFTAGVNLGGWISQYGPRLDKNRFDSFITEADIEQIANWGMDHVRLPVDYPVVEDDENPGQFKEEGFAYIDACIEWCRKRNLGVIIDLHRAPGYSFGTLDSNTLFEDENQQLRYIRIWETIATRYKQEGDSLQLELLNEMVEPTSDRWNRLAHRTIQAIRKVDATRKIIFGGNHYNAITELKNVALVEDDDNIIYTFHFYKPHLFTHQKASWDRITRLYEQEVHYPGAFPGLDTYVLEYPEFIPAILDYPAYISKQGLETFMQPALDFIAQTKKPLYCGEFGVIDNAPMDSRIAWHRDFIELLREANIGRAVWSYKQMSFGLVDGESCVVNEELVRVVSQG